MKIKKIELCSLNTNIDLMPQTTVPEYAFIGRSNVGKSSLINALTNRKKLALTSSRQGKTKSINHFKVNDKYFIVDMPGYGYIRDSHKMQKKLQKTIQNYILKRQQLHCLFLLIDINISPQNIDIDFMNWLGQKKVPFVIIFTKADKIPKKLHNQKIKTYRDTILNLWETTPPIIISSSKKKMGIDNIMKQILSFYKLFNS